MKKFLGFVVSVCAFMSAVGSYVMLGVALIDKAKTVVDNSSRKAKIKSNFKVLGLLTAAGYMFYSAYRQMINVDEAVNDYIDDSMDIFNNKHKCCCEECEEEGIEE